MEKKETFNVMDMAANYASANNMDVSDLFKKPEPVKDEPKDHSKEKESVITPVTKKKETWVPDASLTEGMDEFSGQPVTFSKDEIKEDGAETLKNIIDEDAKSGALESMTEMSRMTANIEEAKKRLGITKLKVPEGQFQVMVYNAACDTNHESAQKALDDIFRMFIDKYPEFILERIDPNKSSTDKVVDNKPETTGDKIINIPTNASNDVEPSEHIEETVTDENDEKDVNLIIDKSHLPEIAWSDDDIDKIKKARTVELNIVEGNNIKFGEIEDADDNIVDMVISKYVRKNNDISVSLPASRYRCTVTGLSYPEVIDLSNSNEMNNIDGERKKWSICFDHIKNPSIGPWRQYRWYIDPVTKKRIELDYNDTNIPSGIDETDIHIVTRFEDFLMKTSFMDLEFILWKVLCATCMDTEIISINCRATMEDGHECGHQYDWLYSPNDLLLVDSINPAVLEEMEKTATVSTSEDIMKNYNESLLMKKNVVKLPDSGISVVFGHISAYDYLNSVYGDIKSLEDESSDDPTLASRGLNYTTLTVLKEFLVPNDNGKYYSIKGTANMFKILNNLDEVDWLTIGELVPMMTEPYQFSYSLRDLTCPKCKSKSNIPIESMTQLLFIVARSLSSVQVTFKSN